MTIEGSWAIGGWSDETRDNSTVLPFPTVPDGAGAATISLAASVPVSTSPKPLMMMR